jgi:predicted peptidase
MTSVPSLRCANLIQQGTSNVDDLEARIFADDQTGLALPYRLFVPKEGNNQAPFGLLVFLHGAGERGSDNRSQLKNRALAWTSMDVQAEHPTIVVYPQCPSDMQWVDTSWDVATYSIAKVPVSRPMTAVLKLLTLLQQRLPVDGRRLLVTGLSMGGFGTFDLVARHPEMFAGALALCGGGDPAQAPSLRNLPLWIFHGDSDPAVPVKGARCMAQALRGVGGTPRYTEVAGGGHDVWNVAYRDPDVLRWLLAQKR